LIKRVLEFLQKLGIILAVVNLLWVGYILLTKGEESASLSKAKGILINILIGLFFIFAAWLIVTMIMKGLGSENTDLLNDE
jgi:hypothetical protein